MSNGSPFWFGQLGYMQQVELDPGVSRTTERGRGELTTVGGVRYVQKSRHAPRTWEGGMTLQSPDAVALLQAAAQGVVKDCWLYDVAGARANMLPPHLTAGNGGPVTVGWYDSFMESRRNLATIPQYKGVGWATAYGMGEVGTDAATTGVGPTGTTVSFYRRTISVAKTSGVNNVGRNEPLSGKSGDQITGSIYVRSSHAVSIKPQMYFRTGSTTITSVIGSPVTLTPNAWTRLSVTVTATADWATDVRFIASMDSSSTLPAGGTLDATCMMLERGSSLLSYFDGDTAGSSSIKHGWVGGVNASQSVRWNVMPAGGFPVGAITPGQAAQVPVLAGRTYTVSAWTPATGNVLSYRLGSGSTVNVASSGGKVSATFTPSSDQILTVTVTGANVSGLRVHEGAPDGKWHPGYGTPCRVDVEDPSTTLQAVWGQEVRADHQFIVREVGIPGSI